MNLFACKFSGKHTVTQTLHYLTDTTWFRTDVSHSSTFYCWYLFLPIYSWYNKFIACHDVMLHVFFFGSGFSLAFLKGTENDANEMFHILPLLLAPWITEKFGN